MIKFWNNYTRTRNKLFVIRLSCESVFSNFSHFTVSTTIRSRDNLTIVSVGIVCPFAFDIAQWIHLEYAWYYCVRARYALEEKRIVRFEFVVTEQRVY